MWEGQEARPPARRSSGTAGPFLGFRGLGLGKIGGGVPRYDNGVAVCRGAGIGLFLDPQQILVRDFPAEVLVLAALLEILFEKDGTSRIRDERAGSRQQDIASAILHFHTSPEKRGVPSHPVLSV